MMHEHFELDSRSADPPCTVRRGLVRLGANAVVALALSLAGISAQAQTDLLEGVRSVPIEELNASLGTLSDAAETLAGDLAGPDGAVRAADLARTISAFETVANVAKYAGYVGFVFELALSFLPQEEDRIYTAIQDLDSKVDKLSNSIDDQFALQAAVINYQNQVGSVTASVASIKSFVQTLDDYNKGVMQAEERGGLPPSNFNLQQIDVGDLMAFSGIIAHHCTNSEFNGNLFRAAADADDGSVPRVIAIGKVMLTRLTQAQRLHAVAFAHDMGQDVNFVGMDKTARLREAASVAASPYTHHIEICKDKLIEELERLEDNDVVLEYVKKYVDRKRKNSLQRTSMSIPS